MSICGKCKKRNTCVELCESAKNYTNQDYVNQTEITFTEIGIRSADNLLDKEFSDSLWPEDLAANYTEEITRFDFLTDLENEIISMYTLQNYTSKYIGEKFGLSHQAVRHRIVRIKKKIMEHFSL